MYKGAIELLNGFPDPADIGMPQRRKNTWVIKLGSHLGAARCCNGTARAVAVEEQTLFARASASFSRVACSHRLERERDFDWIHPPNPSLSPALATRCHALTHASLIRASRPSHSGLFLLSFYTFFSHTPSLTSLTYRIRSLQLPTPCADNLRHLYA